MPVSSDWHLDKKFGVALLTALVSQAAVGIWQVSKMDSRIGFLEVRQASVMVQVSDTNSQLSSLKGDMRELTVEIRHLNRSLQRLNNVTGDGGL